MHDGVVFDSLLQGRVQDPWIGRAHGIGPNCFGPAISPHHVLEIIPGVSMGRPGWVMSAHTLIAIILRIITIYFELEDDDSALLKMFRKTQGDRPAKKQKIPKLSFKSLGTKVEQPSPEVCSTSKYNSFRNWGMARTCHARCAAQKSPSGLSYRVGLGFFGVKADTQSSDLPARSNRMGRNCNDGTGFIPPSVPIHRR